MSSYYAASLKNLILLALCLITSALMFLPLLRHDSQTSSLKYLAYLPGAISLAITLVTIERLSFPQVTIGQNAFLIIGAVLAGLLAVPITWLLSTPFVMFHFGFGLRPPWGLGDTTLLILVIPVIYFTTAWYFVGMVYEHIHPEFIDSILSIRLVTSVLSIGLISAGLYSLENELNNLTLAMIMLSYIAIPLNTLWISLLCHVHKD